MGLRETAEDIVQETFLRCLKHSHKCPPVQYVSTWLYTIAANLAKTELRRRNPEARVGLGVRSSAEAWASSVLDTIGQNGAVRRRAPWKWMPMSKE